MSYSAIPVWATTSSTVGLNPWITCPVRESRHPKAGATLAMGYHHSFRCSWLWVLNLVELDQCLGSIMVVVGDLSHRRGQRTMALLQPWVQVIMLWIEMWQLMRTSLQVFATQWGVHPLTTRLSGNRVLFTVSKRTIITSLDPMSKTPTTSEMHRTTLSWLI